MIILLSFTILVIVILRSWLRMLADSNSCNVPGPLPLPIIGNSHLFIGDQTKINKVFTQLVNKYSDACRIYLLSHRYVILSHPKYIEPLLISSELINKGRFYDVLRPWLGNGLASSSGSIWKIHRKLIAPAFHFKILQSFLPVFIKNQRIFRKKLTALADGTPQNVPDMLIKLTFDNVAETALGVSFNTQNQAKSGYFVATEEITPIIANRFRNPLLANDFLFSLSRQKERLDKFLAIAHKYSDDVIKRRRQEFQDLNVTTSSLTDDSEFGAKTKNSFLDSLLLAEQDGEKMDDQTIASHVDTFMFAGHETIANTAGYALYCISNHKEVQEKILEE